MSKPFISIIEDRYFGFVVMISDRRPWVDLGNGLWYFQANSYTIRLMRDYRVFLNSFNYGELSK